MRIVSRVTVIIAGVVALILGLLVVIGSFIAMFQNAGQSAFENTLFGASAEAVVQYSTLFAGVALVFGGLLFLGPVRIGRAFRAGGYTTSDRDVIPKAYKAGGWVIIVAALASAIVSWLFVGLTVLDIVLLAIAALTGIAGVFNGYGLQAANRSGTGSPPDAGSATAQ